MHGWNGKILRVDLTRGRLTTEALDPKVARDYVGGRGLGIHYLNREVDPTCDPLSPANLLVMATGPLTGTRAPTRRGIASRRCWLTPASRWSARICRVTARRAALSPSTPRRRWPVTWLP